MICPQVRKDGEEALTATPSSQRHDELGCAEAQEAGAQDHASHPADGDHADANLADEMTGGTRASTHSSGPEITI